MGYWNLSGGHLDRVESITDGSRLVTLKSFNYLKNGYYYSCSIDARKNSQKDEVICI